MDGTVVESKRTYGSFAGGYGTNGEYITIDHHNGYYTMYAHLCPGCRYVKVGDTVSKGQIIAGMVKQDGQQEYIYTSLFGEDSLLSR